MGSPLPDHVLSELRAADDESSGVGAMWALGYVAAGAERAAKNLERFAGRYPLAADDPSLAEARALLGEVLVLHQAHTAIREEKMRALREQRAGNEDCLSCGHARRDHAVEGPDGHCLDCDCPRFVAGVESHAETRASLGARREVDR